MFNKNKNTGIDNSGNFNSGNFNSSNFNSSNYNSGNFNSVIFNTEERIDELVRDLKKVVSILKSEAKQRILKEVHQAETDQIRKIEEWAKKAKRTDDAQMSHDHVYDEALSDLLSFLKSLPINEQ